MIKKVYIYTLTNPLNNQVFYVGYTNNSTRRLNEHIKYKYNPYKDSVINDIIQNSQKPILKVIDECERIYNKKESIYEHEKLEIFYIKKYRDSGYDLTNMTDGGGDTVNYLKKRIFKYDQFGNFVKEYESISEAGIEHNINPDNIGHAVDQRIKKSSCCYYWFTSHEEAKKFIFRIIFKSESPILQYSLDCKFIKEFKNKREIYDSLNIQRKSIKNGYSSLTRVLNSNGKKSAHGYLWFYKGNKPKRIIRSKILRGKETMQYNLN